MSASAVNISSLSKRFGSGRKQVTAVDSIDLEIAPGQVYGFLGPNGAGKSTTIRMILDLIRPSTGQVQVFGQNVHQNTRVLQKVGALVEGAHFYPFLSGRKNLEVLARTSGRVDQRRITSLLEQVALSDRADRKVRGYSMGMKQRLGLAAALLDNPELIILDEPANGLDPAGIQELRTFIRRLVDEQGKTVFFSSHILSEVEMVCDRVAIISKGRIVREGTPSMLLSNKPILRIEADPLAQAADLLRESWPVTVNDHTLTVSTQREDTPKIIARLSQAGISIYEVVVQRQSLEEFFLDVTQEKDEDDFDF